MVKILSRWLLVPVFLSAITLTAGAAEWPSQPLQPGAGVMARLMDKTMAYAEQVAAQASIAVRFAKRTLAGSLDNSFLAQLELEWPYQVAAFDTDDATEGIAAFRERRPPRFSGR